MHRSNCYLAGIIVPIVQEGFSTKGKMATAQSHTAEDGWSHDLQWSSMVLEPMIVTVLPDLALWVGIKPESRHAELTVLGC